MKWFYVFLKLAPSSLLLLHQSALRQYRSRKQTVHSMLISQGAEGVLGVTEGVASRPISLNLSMS